MSQITVAGATGDVGSQIVLELVKMGVKVKAIVRSAQKSGKLIDPNVEIVEAQFDDHDSLVKACTGSQCVVSALNGTTKIIKIAQNQLLEAALEAKVQRFIPSDFSIDYTRFESGRNRNLDLRRDFAKQLQNESIKSTSIFNGALAYLLTHTQGYIDSSKKQVLYWGDNPDIRTDFTTVKDVAMYTARVAISKDAPEVVHIRSVSMSPNQLVTHASRISNQQYTLFRCGSLESLRSQIQQLKDSDTDPEANSLPMWQALQYGENIFSGFGSWPTDDNERFGVLQWSTIDDILAPLKE